MPLPESSKKEKGFSIREKNLTNAQRTARYNAARDRVANQAFVQSRNAQRQTLKLIAEMRQRVVARVAVTDFEAFNLKQVLDSLDESVAAFESRYASVLSKAQGEAYEFGAAALDKGFKAAQYGVELPLMSQTRLEILRAGNSALVSGVTATMRQQISVELSQVFIGAISPHDAMKTLRSMFATQATGPMKRFGGVTERARRIVRTETRSVQEFASKIRRKQWEDAGVEKMLVLWDGCFERPGHTALNGSSVPLGERFTLIGADGVVYKPEYPHDSSALPVGEVVNCGGFSTTIKTEWADAA